MAIRHPLDVIVNEIGLETVAAKVVRPLGGRKSRPRRKKPAGLPMPVMPGREESEP